jgi:hypothetical protein
MKVMKLRIEQIPQHLGRKSGIDTISCLQRAIDPLISPRSLSAADRETDLVKSYGMVTVTGLVGTLSRPLASADVT